MIVGPRGPRSYRIRMDAVSPLLIPCALRRRSSAAVAAPQRRWATVTGSRPRCCRWGLRSPPEEAESGKKRAERLHEVGLIKTLPQKLIAQGVSAVLKVA